MATVTGMTAAAMQAIRDGTVVSGHYDSAGHLILVKYDGSQVDGGAAPGATTAQAGIVELATSAETQTGTDTVRAVTPAGLASLPGTRVQILSSPPAESAVQSSYPTGVSMMDVSGWTPGNGFGTVVTHNVSAYRCEQTFYSATGGTSHPRAFIRHHNTADGGGGWTAWHEFAIVSTLLASNYTQATAAASYPNGRSRIWYTSANSGSWDFNGMNGEVDTYWDSTNAFARQTFTQRTAGNTTTPEVWIRTSDNTVGWSAWKKLIHDPGSYLTWTPTWSTTSGIHLPSFGNAVATFKAHKLGKNVHVTFDVAFGSTTNFGATPATTDNWTFSLPPAWPANTNPPGSFLGVGDMYKDPTNLGFTRIKLSGATAISFGILTCFVAGALGGGIGGDVDSITPWTWASGHAIRGSFDYETTA
jgi:hypothetical protein